MNPSATIPLTQMFLSWTLLGVLCAWMLFCAFLAFRPLETEKQEEADLFTPSGEFPIFVQQTRQTSLHQHALSPGGLVTVPAESANEVDAAPVA